ncbi:phosphoribosyltransferase family protein [Teredinibacter purpureus]|uniref:phosphoribosyltransferase family protein n=1 Tax=Teredinibacter purpureus TaxID=2731756 RepID=UPI0005F8385C|nr:phosphoribosyltransferase family protein [Teredinibacter purpureus]
MKNAKKLFSFDESQQAIVGLSDKLNRHYRSSSSNGKKPVIVLSLLNGGMVFSGLLLPHLNFPLLLDSICVSRYRQKTTGADLQWHSYPGVDLSGSEVLLLDDIYDEGITLAMVKAWCLSQGAEHVITSVLAWKQLPPKKQRAEVLECPDFFALQVPDEFVVGLGMDSAGLYRNAPGIYVLDEK